MEIKSISQTIMTGKTPKPNHHYLYKYWIDLRLRIEVNKRFKDVKLTRIK